MTYHVYLAIAGWVVLWAISLRLAYWIGVNSGLKQAKAIIFDDDDGEWLETFVSEERKRLGLDKEDAL